MRGRKRKISFFLMFEVRMMAAKGIGVLLETVAALKLLKKQGLLGVVPQYL